MAKGPSKTMRSHILTEDGDARLLLLIDDGMLYVMDIDTQTGVRLPLETWSQVRAFVDGIDVAMTAVLDERRTDGEGHG